MEAIVTWYESGIGAWMPKELFCFFVSMIPLIELRGGLVAAKLLDIPLLFANLICIAGNIVPIPFILLFIRGIFAWMKEHHILVGFVEWLEKHAEKKSKGQERGQFVFLWLFVGVPLPGTGAWTGSLIASLFRYDIKEASLAILLGLLTATLIMDILSYGLLGLIFG